MYTSTVILTLLSSALLTIAAPSPTLSVLAPRACQTAYPQSIGFPINYSISQSAGGTDKQDNFVSFSIPDGSYGCSLRADFPPDYPITKSGNSQVYVFDTATNSHVGTVEFVSPMATTINSFACKPSLSYRLSIGSATEAGSVAFAGTQDAGLTMTYNC